MSDLERTPFEQTISQLLGDAVAAARPPASLGAAIRSRCEAPDAVAVLTAVNAIAAPIGLRERVASAVTAAATIAPKPKPRFTPQQLPLVIAAVAAAAAAVAALVYMAVNDDDASRRGPTTVAAVAPGDDGGADTLPPLPTAGVVPPPVPPLDSSTSTSSTTTQPPATSGVPAVPPPPPPPPPPPSLTTTTVATPPATTSTTSTTIPTTSPPSSSSPPTTSPPTTSPPTTSPPTTSPPPTSPPSTTPPSTTSPPPTTVPPAVAVVMSGDGLSMVGNDVDYVITVTNTSSGGSPDLVNGTIVDSVLGDLLDPDNPFVTVRDCAQTLAGGTSCTIDATRTVESTDPDPLSNTVTVHYQPDGFPNDVTDSASHQVDLVHPDLAVSKTCAPANAPPGAPIDYTCTISNTGDVGLDRISITDTLKGDLTDPANFTSSTCDDSLAPDTSCTITYTVTAPSTAGPLVNTVTATYQVQGLPDQLTESDTCTVQIVAGDDCGPGFWKNHPELWDENSDLVSENVRAAVDAKGEPYVHDPAVDGVDDQLFRNIFGVTAAELNPDLTMAQALDLGGGGFNRLARQGVAGLLNSGTTESSYPLTSDDVLTMVHDAIVNGDPEDTADMLEEANEFGCPLN